MTPTRLRTLIAETHKHGVMLAALNRRRRKNLVKILATAHAPRREGIDYVSLTPKDVKATGARFVMRYLSHDAAKDIDVSEIHALRALGIAIGFVWETTATRALAGQAAGMDDANQARKRLQALGVPLTVPCYFAVDFDAVPGSIDAYFTGARHVLGDRTGVYGSFRVVQHLHTRGIKWMWQTYAWSLSQVYPSAQLLQYANGARYDHDRTTTSVAGLWERT